MNSGNGTPGKIFTLFPRRVRSQEMRNGFQFKCSGTDYFIYKFGNRHTFIRKLIFFFTKALLRARWPPQLFHRNMAEALTRLADYSEANSGAETESNSTTSFRWSRRILHVYFKLSIQYALQHFSCFLQLHQRNDDLFPKLLQRP
jgi:hypothetical protein